MYVPVNPCIVRLGLYRQDALLCHRSDVHHSVGTQCRVGGWLSVHVEDPPRWTLQVKLNTLLHKQNKTKHHHQQDIRHVGRLHPHTRALRHTYIRTDNKNTVFICFPSHEDVQLGSLVSVGCQKGEVGFSGMGTLHRGLLSLPVLLPIPKSHWSTREKVLKCCVMNPEWLVAAEISLCCCFILSS